MRDHYIEALKMCYAAATASGDRSTKNGAVVVDGDGKLVINPVFNSPLFDLVPRDREHKLWVTSHAEEAAMVSFTEAVPFGSVGPFALVATWAACASCARLVTQLGLPRGLRTLVRHMPSSRPVRPEWKQSIDAGDEIFRAAGFYIVEITDFLDVDLYFNGTVLRV